MKNENILVVDDEPDLLELLRFNLENEGYNVFTALDGEEAMSVLYDEVIDLAVLDVMLPEFSGYEICRRMRKDERLKTIPVIFVTARSEETDMLTGFHNGGDDYLPKPFSPKILKARVQALLSRTRGARDSYILRELELFFDRHILKLAGERVSMTPREFSVLSTLIQRKNKTVSRNTLLERGWGMETTSSSRSVDIVITRLRSKLSNFGNCIRTVTGYGYQWDEEGFAQVG